MAPLRAVSFQSSIPSLLSPLSSNRPKAFRVFFALRNGGNKTSFASLRSPLNSSRTSSLRFVPLASEAEAIEVEPVVEESSDSVVESEDSSNDVPESDTSDASEDNVEEEAVSPVIASLESYKEALANGDESKVVEVTSFLKSLEDEKTSLQMKVVAISQELSTERDRVIRISADFDNFRKRTERERSSLMSNAQGEVVEKLLGVLDNFERAKEQIKVENEKEEKISNSYQSIYKQLSEILTSLGVVSVETVGKPFDPLFHEAIMREDSSEFEEGIVLQEFCKGFRIGERLLRPSMVKVSAGPGPAKAEEAVEEENEGGIDESKGADEESQGHESV